MWPGTPCVSNFGDGIVPGLHTLPSSGRDMSTSFMTYSEQLRLNGCEHFVDLSHLTHAERRTAANWALTHVRHPNVNVWRLGPNDEPGFWFRNSQDAVMFALKWA